MTQPQTIFEFIKSQESYYDTQNVEIFDNYSWNMKRHIQMSVSFMNSQFLEGSNDYKTKNPFKNIVRPIMNLRYRAVNIDVKDIDIYVENRANTHLSFLVKKYYQEVFIKENDLDTFFDKAQEESEALGGVLIQKTKMSCPELIHLQSIAFCNQTDILSSPIGIKYNFSPDKLREMTEKGWGETKNGASISIEDLIKLADDQKDSFQPSSGTKKNTIPGKNIEVYIVMGTMPEAYLKDNENMDDYVRQIQVVAFYYSDKQKDRVGVTLYRKEESESRLKFHTNKDIFGRALGEGGVEELFDAQIWTNFFEIHKKKLLEAASKVGLVTDDQSYVNRQKIIEMENLEITTIEEGKTIKQIPTFAPQRIQLFEQSVNEWYQHAQLTASAQDPLLGKRPPSGEPFRAQQLQVIEGNSLHEYRLGKYAKWFEEIYKDWIIPYIEKEIVKGHEFLATLTSDEMNWICEKMAENEANRIRNEQVLNGEIPQDKETLKGRIMQEFSAGGNKRWITILEDEFKDMPLAVSVSIAGKQKNLTQMVDKITSIFRFVFSNPAGFQQTMQIPGMSQAFNDILELSGLRPVDFAGVSQMIPQQTQQSPQSPQQPQQQAQMMQLPTNQMAQAAY